jgi:hypothetical protein
MQPVKAILDDEESVFANAVVQGSILQNRLLAKIFTNL